MSVACAGAGCSRVCCCGARRLPPPGSRSRASARFRCSEPRHAKRLPAATRPPLTGKVHPNAELYPWLSAAALAWGILDCFFGYRVFKVTLALVGGFLGALAGEAAAQALGWGPGGTIAISLVGGLLGAGLAFML